MNQICTWAVAIVGTAMVVGCQSSPSPDNGTHPGGTPALGGNATPGSAGSPGTNDAGTGVNNGGTLPMNGMH